MRNKIVLNSATKELTLTEGYNNFIKSKRLNNLSEDTIKYYNRCYKPFEQFFGSDFLCNDFNDTLLENYLENLKNERNLSPITVNTHIRGIRALLYYFMGKNYSAQFKIRLIKADKPVKEIYTDEEITKLIRKPDISKDSFAQYRNWVIVCYLLATGNRLRTVRNIKLCDLDFQDMQITLHHVKNRKAYIIPMSTSLKKILEEYVSYRGGGNEDYLFCNSYGEKMTKDTFVTAIVQYNKSRGVNKTSIHLFRHTFAKNWIMNGGDIFRLQKMLGHSSLEMVKEYVSIYGGDLKENFDKFNALENYSHSFDSKKAIKLK